MISREAPLSVFDIVYVTPPLFVLFHLKILFPVNMICPTYGMIQESANLFPAHVILPGALFRRIPVRARR
ncbi:MAG: hypothetical protein HFG92_07145 [Dorea sp.]|jgi:hypothetical protein|nr:hypothetical protein [Dorea sp.]